MHKTPRVVEALEPLRASLREEAGHLSAMLEPLRKRREELVAQIQPLEAQLRVVDEDIAVAEEPLRKVNRELAAIERQIAPGPVLQAETAVATATGSDLS